METVKSAVGLGKAKESGEEPVSGETGTGTTAEPYDAGNSNEAQEVAKAQPEQQDTEETKDIESKDTSSGGGGGSSWLKSANPFSKKSKDTTDEQASAGAAKAEPSQPAAVEDESALPPNHLGVNVPSGHSLDFASPQPEQTTASPTESKKEQKMASTEPNPTVTAASAEGTDQTSPLRSGSASKSPAQLRGSRASVAEPAGTRIFNPAGQNPGRIPTAGGRPLGEAASEDRRRRSVWSSTSGGDEGGSSSRQEMPKLDKQGSPDPVTQNNTVVNTVPQSTNGEGSSKGAAAANGATTTTAAPAAAPAPAAEQPKPAKEPKPDFNTFAWGEGGEGAATNSSKAGTSTTDASSAAPSKTEQAKEKVKDAVPSSGGNGNNGSATKERRASRIGRFFGKKS